MYSGGFTMTKDELLSREHNANSTQTWLLRIAGLVMAWAAVFCCFAPIAFAADVFGDVLNFIPCCGNMLEGIVEGVVNFVLCCLSCAIGCSCGLLVIAVMWVFMRPLVGGTLLVI